VLADTDEKMIGKQVELGDRTTLFATAKTSLVTSADSRAALVAHARSPGYETYRTGWHSLIIEFRDVR
jgi:hypothetical protein